MPVALHCPGNKAVFPPGGKQSCVSKVLAHVPGTLPTLNFFSFHDEQLEMVYWPGIQFGLEKPNIAQIS